MPVTNNHHDLYSKSITATRLFRIKLSGSQILIFADKYHDLLQQENNDPY